MQQRLPFRGGFTSLLGLPRVRELPLDRPIAVHGLTSLGGLGGVEARRILGHLWTDNALLVPPVRRGSPKARKCWPAGRLNERTHTVTVYDRDRSAGDDEYLFFSLNERFDYGKYVSVAYYLSDLCKPQRRGRTTARVGFRPHDLEGNYSKLDNLKSSGDWCGCGPDADEYDCKCSEWDCVGEELHEIVDAGTVWGCDKTLRLAQLHLDAERIGNTMEAADPLIADKIKAMKECNEYLHKYATDEWTDYADEVATATCEGITSIDWSKPFRSGGHLGTPEILYRGGLRLHDAAYLTVDANTWVRLK